MMKKALFVSMLFNLFTASLCWSQETPTLLRINGRALPPACLLPFVTPHPKDVIDLNHHACMRVRTPYDERALKQGLSGYQISESVSPYPGMRIYYRYLGEMIRGQKSTKALLVLWSGGGSGLFSQLLFLKNDKRMLRRVDAMSGGDRCMGGISQAEIAHGILRYQRNVTPQMLMSMNQKQVSYESLSDCAVCCIGILTYRNDKVIGFQFTHALADNDKDNNAMQCFNRVADLYGRQKARHLSRVMLQAFRDTVKKACDVRPLK